MVKALKKFYEKLGKLPVWSGMLAVLAACIVANIPTMLQFDAIWASVWEMYAEAVPGFNPQNLPAYYKYVISVISAFVAWGVFELIAYLVSMLVLQGSARRSNKNMFYNAVRYTYAVEKLIVGLYSLTAVYAPEVYVYSYQWLDFILLTTLFSFCYLGLKERYVNDNYVFDIYARLYSIWFIYSGIVSVLDFLMTILDPTAPVSDIVATSVMLGLVAAAALILYFTMFKKLKQEQTENRKRFTPPPPPPFGQGGFGQGGPGKPDDDEVFKGYGL